MRALRLAAVRSAGRDDAEQVTQLLPGDVVDLHDVRHGWARVTVPGQPSSRHPDGYPGWVRAADLTDDVLDVARTFVGAPYLWGGLTRAGIDCSGLVHVSFRLLGVEVPRDASDQADAARPVPLGEERPGDLYFFARAGQPVHHVGLVVSTGVILHAPDSGGRRAVVEEPLAEERRATVVGVGRVGG